MVEKNANRSSVQDRTIDYIYFGLFSAIVVFLFWKCRIGYAHMDESFYLSVPYRLCQGDGLFIHEWNLSQTSAVLLYPIMRIYLLITQSTEGILLHLRWIFTTVWSLSALFTGIRIRRCSRAGACVASLAVLIYTPFGIMALSYNSLCILLLLDACVLFLTAEKRTGPLIISGVLFAGAVLCCPYLAVLYGLFSAGAFFSLILWKKKESIRNWLLITEGCGILFLLFCILVLSRCSVADIVKAWPWIMDDSHMSVTLWDKVLEYYNSIMLSAGSVRWVLLLTAVLSVVCRIFRQLRPVGLLAVITGVTVCLLEFITARQYLNYLMFPIALTGLFCAATSESKSIRAIFCCVWIPGFLYSFLNNIASNQAFYNISSTMTVATFASIVMLPMYIRELQLKKSVLFRTAVAAAVSVMLATQMFSELYLRYSLVFWESSAAEQTVPAERGPEKGIRMTPERLEEYHTLLAELEEIKNIPEQCPVLFTADSSVSYLYTGKRFAAYSAWLTENSLEKLKQYYELNPDKMPGIVMIDQSLFYSAKLYAYFFEMGYRKTDANGHMFMLSNLSSLTEKTDSLTGTELMPDASSVQLSHAEIAGEQFNGKPVIICRGVLRRGSQDTEVSVDEYLRNTDYVGFRLEAEDIQLVTFYGKKISDHGQPTVYAYDQEGNVIAWCSDSYQFSDTQWCEYALDVSGGKGPVTLIFNGGYIDNTGSSDSQYAFSNIVLYRSSTAEN